jgi:hypothetical protein
MCSNRKRLLGRKALVLLAGGVLIVALFAGALSFRAHVRLEKVGQIEIGDTKVIVEQKLGNPLAVFDHQLAQLKFGGEVWVYGDVIDFGAIVTWDLPIKMRVIGPEEGDSVIVFSPSGTVKAVIKRWNSHENRP